MTDMPGQRAIWSRRRVDIEGLEVTLVDTAGVAGDGDRVEREGVRRGARRASVAT